METSNAEHRTPNAERLARGNFIRRSAFDVRRSMFAAFLLLFSFRAFLPVAAQLPGQPQLDPQLHLMMTQPPIDVTAEVQATAGFDPPIVGPGEMSTWRVSFNALDESIRWPENFTPPDGLELRLSARGEMLMPAVDRLQPRTTINHHARAAAIGSYTIPAFEVQVYGRRVTVPATTLEVVALPPINSPRRLYVELAEANAYAGQPVVARVYCLASVSNMVEAVSELRLKGDHFLVDQGIARNVIGMLPFHGTNVGAYMFETVLTPLRTGTITITAQGFSAGNRFTGAISVQGRVSIAGNAPQFVLLDADPVTLNVRPLPPIAESAGFTGAIGKFSCDPPRLGTNVVRVGEHASLAVTFHSPANLTRFVAPPAPLPPDWQVSSPVTIGISPMAPVLPGSPPTENSVSFVYPMVPLTNSVKATPPIPFTYFDPERGAYVDLTIPSVPITVVSGATTVDAATLMAADRATAAEEKKLTMSDLANAPGRMTESLVPLQHRAGFVFVQLLPVIGFLGLWKWDQRRRYLERHPDIVWRRRARRALRREKRALQRALEAGDALGYATTAVRAMQVAVAPHFPAEPAALVGGDVLELLGTNGRAETVRRFFAVADASQFSGKTADATSLLALQPELTKVLDELEAKL
jgi:hypothetical protein